MRFSMKPWLASATVLLGLTCLAPGPALAADEGLQVQMLKQMFRLPHPDWPGVLRENSSLLDSSFFERLDKRVRWSADNNQIDDAIRFAMVGDFAADAVGRVGGYRLALILGFQKGGNDDLARSLIDNVMLTHPDFKEVRYLRAAYRRTDGDWAGALDDYNQLVSKGFKLDECYYFIGAIQLGLNKEKEAFDAFTRSALPQAKAELEKLKYVANDTPFSGIAPVGSNNPQGDPKMFAQYFKQAEVAEKAGKLGEAENYYVRATSANPNEPQPFIQFGGLLYRLGKVNQALQALHRGLSLNPKSGEGWRFVAVCFERRYDQERRAADHAEATKAYKKLLEQQPGDPVAEMGLARLAAKKPTP